MSFTTEIIDSANYIYSAYTKWGLKKYVCEVSFFTEEPLDDLYYVICSILDSNEGGYYDKRSLGVLLGFCMSNSGSGGEHEMYYDVAEVRIFEDILSKVENEHLIEVRNHDIFLTDLGRISVKERKHYRFYVGTQDVYEHSALKSETPIAMLMFPFYNDMGIFTELKTRKQIWPEDEDIEKIIYSQGNQLIKRLELHSRQFPKIYNAVLQEYFDLEVKKIPVNLYQSGEEYIPVIMNGDKIAIRATDLIDEKLNAQRKEDIILECLFQKLWDDKSAILTYSVLEPYIDLIDFEELTKDSRTVWEDPELFQLVVDRATPTCWRNITRYCSLDVLRSYIGKYKENIFWPIIIERIDDDFLLGHFVEYPWDLEVLSEDRNRKDSVIEQLIIKGKDTEEDWNWDELEKRLSQDFVLSHLDIVRVNLSSYTHDTIPVRQTILRNLDKRWDWDKIESEFDLQFIYENINSIGSYLSFNLLFDRIFTDTKWADKFATNPSFNSEVSKACKEGRRLSTSIFNDKDYIWTSNIIDLLISNGLLCWASTPYMPGFECNPKVEWSEDFFKRYSPYIVTEEGRRFVSSKISDISIIVNSTSFKWDWDAISGNANLLSVPDLYTHFGNQLNWHIILTYQKDASFLQSILGIEDMIGEDKDAWSLFSAIAETEYVVKKYRESQFPWDWTVLTERMFPQLKLEKLGNKFFVDKWDWSYLSEHVDTIFLNQNLEQFKTYWNWEVVFPRLLTTERKFDYNYLDKLADVLTKIPENAIRQSAWTALTSQFSFKDLKKLIKDTSLKRSYWWDMNYFCQHKDFSVFRDLEECRNVVNWDILSSSPSVDNSFKYDSRLGIKERAWHDEIRKLLSDQRNHWNFALLSHFESLRNEKWFINQYREHLDWEYLSQASKIFCTKDKQLLNEIIEANKKYIRFDIISERDDVDIDQIVRIYPVADYNFNSLIEKNVISVTQNLIEEKPDYSWDWMKVSSSKTFYPTAEFLLSHIDCNFNWAFLSNQDNKQAWGDEKVIITVASNSEISSQIDWYSLSSLGYFPLNENIIRVLPLEKLNWKQLSGRKVILPFVDELTDYLDWRAVSQNRHLISLETEVLEKYKENLDWDVICHREGFVFTNEILSQFSDYIDWTLASASLNIKFTKDLVDKYKDRWDWPVLMKNKAFNNTIDISGLPYARQINIVDFINKFPRKPQAFHFTHMDNAIKIIRTMKLQSRNNAEGHFSNSAGNNVHRTTKAHRFARFYFMPKSPTQFYNECLGKDIDYSKYQKALNLGLPKCPLPVFFVFDIEEILSVMPDLCYYSNGNMQKDSSKCFKVVENPNRIKAKEIYINSFDTFDERQQEFLVEGELDFSKLKHVQICCYDSYQMEKLKEELKGTKWEDIVTIGTNLYEYKNKELHFDETQDTIRIRTNYKNPFEFRISYTGSNAPSILNKQNVLRQRGNNIYLSSVVEVKKDTPFSVYFEVNSPRSGSWLIFRNK